jgi:hypothetical protein
MADADGVWIMGCPRRVHYPCLLELGEIFLRPLVARVLFQQLKGCVIGLESNVVGGHTEMSLATYAFFASSSEVPLRPFQASLMRRQLK